MLEDDMCIYYPFFGKVGGGRRGLNTGFNSTVINGRKVVIVIVERKEVKVKVKRIYVCVYM